MNDIWEFQLNIELIQTEEKIQTELDIDCDSEIEQDIKIDFNKICHNIQLLSIDLLKYYPMFTTVHIN